MLRVFTCTKCKTYPVQEDVFSRFLSPKLELKAVELANDPSVTALELKFTEGCCMKCGPEAKNLRVELHVVRKKASGKK